MSQKEIFFLSSANSTFTSSHSYFGKIRKSVDFTGGSTSGVVYQFVERFFTLKKAASQQLSHSKL